ncbi:MAG: hypothetical protein HC904_10530 [Blastochloris sp.]|nr:hypothetical protein [Blastochloris sp.]
MVNEVNSNGLALIHIEINEDGSLFKWMQSKDYRAKKGISPLIIQQVRQIVGENVPLCFYPRHTNTFRICAEIFEEFPEQIAAWASYNSVPPQDFAKRLNAFGLLASSNDHVELGKFKKVFEEGRKEGKKLAWMEVKPSAEKDFQSFIWTYFASAAQKKNLSGWIFPTQKKFPKMALILKTLNW